jgi:hypothetical protein
MRRAVGSTIESFAMSHSPRDIFSDCLVARPAQAPCEAVRQVAVRIVQRPQAICVGLIRVLDSSRVCVIKFVEYLNRQFDVTPLTPPVERGAVNFHDATL